MYGYDCVNVCSKIPSALISSATTEKDNVCVCVPLGNSAVNFLNMHFTEINEFTMRKANATDSFKDLPGHPWEFSSSAREVH